jgi:hypothetical protein
LPIRILIPRVKPFENWTPPDNVRVTYKTGATFDSDVICDYLLNDVSEFLVANNISNNQATLYFDSAPCHLTREVEKAFETAQCKKETIGKRCTNLHQPWDVCMFKSIKAA